MPAHAELEGRTALVTGGASGIGAALCAELSDRGMAIVVADIDYEGAQRVAAGLRQRGGTALAVAVDVSDPDSVERLAQAAYAEYGSVELLCNNAGVLLFGTIEDSSLGDWRWLASVNVEGLLNSLHAFLPRMSAQTGWKHVMNTASTHAFLADPSFTALYTATKQAIVAMTQGLRHELREQGFGVTLLCPGQADTRILDSQRNRPERFGRRADEPFGTGDVPLAIGVDEVARRAVAGLLADAEIVFALPSEGLEQFRGQLEEWWRLADDALVRHTEPLT
ncbi:SDR family NAD(P)-dependent oxidoreductase [Streptomyces sp. NPDC033754]|uniref:SDR family NAD(P)-dependent oxidoreductase n=1 Tax=unclassified Streptomyces TaxID=2593676 RepID=UPI00340E5B04